MNLLKELQKTIGKSEARLVTDHNNIQYISGFTGTNGTILLTQRSAYLFTDFRYERIANKVVPEGMKVVIIGKLYEEINKLLKKQNIKELHFDAMDLSVAKLQAIKKEIKKVKIQPSKRFVENVRMVKREDELRLITKAQRIAEETYNKVTKKLKYGMTEAEVAWEIEKTGHELGADTISFPSIVAFGGNSGSPHHMSGSRKLKEGDMVLIDMGMLYKGYCSDMTRTAFTKAPTKEQEKIYNIVLEAQTRAEKEIKAGVKGEDIDKIARDVIKDAGYGDRFGHSLGHGIGLQVHEAPYLSTGYPGPLPENTVVTVEPGIYLENSFGVRIEDMVIVKGKKAVNITKTPKNLERLILSVSKK